MVAHNDPPHQNLRCLQIQMLSFLNKELKDVRKIICLRKSEAYVKEKQFPLSLKYWWSMSAMLLYNDVIDLSS